MALMVQGAGTLHRQFRVVQLELRLHHLQGLYQLIQPVSISRWASQAIILGW